MASLGRSLIFLGLLLAGVGFLLVVGDRLPFRIGRLPGDMVWRGRNSTFYFPLTTSILFSVLLTLLIWLFGRRS